MRGEGLEGRGLETRQQGRGGRGCHGPSETVEAEA